MGGKAQSGFAAVRDGTRIAPTLQLTLGNAPGVVLLHSLALDRYFWQAVIDQLTPIPAIHT
jgi:hypothetical protein